MIGNLLGSRWGTNSRTRARPSNAWASQPSPSRTERSEADDSWRHQLDGPRTTSERSAPASRRRHQACPTGEGDGSWVRFVNSPDMLLILVLKIFILSLDAYPCREMSMHPPVPCVHCPRCLSSPARTGRSRAPGVENPAINTTSCT